MAPTKTKESTVDAIVQKSYAFLIQQLMPNNARGKAVDYTG